MTDSVTSSAPYSYYNLLTPPVKSLAPEVSAVNPASNQTTTATPSAKGAQLSSNVIALLQSFLSGGSSDSSDPLSALLGNSSYSSSSNPVGELLGASNNNSGTLDSLLSNPSEGNLLGNAYTSLLSAAYNGATQQADQTALATDPLQNVLTGYQAYQNTINSSTLDNIQATVAANSYSADGTPLQITA